MSKKFYKFTKAKYLKSILENGGRLKLSNYHELNDPCDLNFKISKEMYNRSFKLFLNIAFLCEFGTMPMFSKNKMFKATYKITKTSLKRNYKYIENLGISLLLNCYLKTRKDLKDFFEKQKYEFNKKYDEIISDLKENALIGSLTTSFNSKTMWAHYADNNKGICVEYEILDDDLFWDVIYTDNDNELDLYTIFQYLLPCYYFKIEKPTSDNMECTNACFRPFRIKTKEWESEKEIRGIFSSTDKTKIINENGIWFYPNAKVKSIYAGCNISDDDLKEIRKSCKENSIKLFLMKIKKGNNRYIVEEDKIL